MIILMETFTLFDVVATTQVDAVWLEVDAETCLEASLVQHTHCFCFYHLGQLEGMLVKIMRGNLGPGRVEPKSLYNFLKRNFRSLASFEAQACSSLPISSLQGVTVWTLNVS